MCTSNGAGLANTNRSGSILRSAAACFSLALVFSPACFNQSTLPGSWASNRIQMVKTGSVIFQLLLKQQNTKPSGGRAASVRLGTLPKARLVSLGKKQLGK